VHLFIYLLIYLFVYLLICLFVYLFIFSFCYLFIWSTPIVCSTMTGRFATFSVWVYPLFAFVRKCLIRSLVSFSRGRGLPSQLASAPFAHATKMAQNESKHHEPFGALEHSVAFYKKNIAFFNLPARRNCQRKIVRIREQSACVM
jgi:hypothetical protein